MRYVRCRTCKLCRYIKMITVEDTLKSLQLMRHELTLGEKIRARADQLG